MKYILVIDQISHGGAERILIDYYHYLENKGNEVTVFSLSGNIKQSEWTKGVNVVYGIKRNNDGIVEKIAQQITLLFRLKQLVQRVRPDVIFSFLEKSNLLTILVPSKAVKVISVHNVLSIQYTKIGSAVIRKLLYFIIHSAYNQCQNVVAVSEQVKNDLVKSFGVKENNVHVINNYVDKEEIHMKAKQTVEDFEFNPSVRYLMNIGRFSDQKAQWKLLKSFFLYLQEEHSPDVELLLMGVGDYIVPLKKLADDLQIKTKVHFLPFNVNPYKYMAHAHLFILSSIYEGFPIVLSEVSSFRIPFVGSDKALPREMFNDSHCWERCIFKSTILVKDFSNRMYEDEHSLAKLINLGVNDKVFRTQILLSTQEWENNNDKLVQFALYDAFYKKTVSL